MCARMNERPGRAGSYTGNVYVVVRQQLWLKPFVSKIAQRARVRREGLEPPVPAKPPCPSCAARGRAGLISKDSYSRCNCGYRGG